MGGRVEGRVCVVTGGASGLGRGFAETFAREGATVVLADIDESLGRKAAEAIGLRAAFMKLDVCDEARWSAVMAETLERFGRLDVLVNNAGILHLADIETETLERWRRLIAVHLDGTMLGCKHGIAAMKAGGRGGSIINIASVGALQGYPMLAAYSAAKGGIISLTRSVALHCKDKGYGIRANCVLPATIDTPMVRGVGVPQGAKGIGVPDDIAGAVLFLASDEARFVTSASFVIDNGFTSIVPRTE